jgi:predicted MPP superfamily phosphohydrolase
MPAGGADAPIRILHLSDAHFSEGSAWDSDPLLREAIDYIRREVAAGLTPDLVAFTGDLAYAGKEAEYKLARDWLDRLWAVLPQDLPRDRLLIVPGNHDVDRNLVTRSNLGEEAGRVPQVYREMARSYPSASLVAAHHQYPRHVDPRCRTQLGLDVLAEGGPRQTPGGAIPDQPDRVGGRCQTCRFLHLLVASPVGLLA